MVWNKSNTKESYYKLGYKDNFDKKLHNITTNVYWRYNIDY